MAVNRSDVPSHKRCGRFTTHDVHRPDPAVTYRGRPSRLWPAGCARNGGETAPARGIRTLTKNVEGNRRLTNFGRRSSPTSRPSWV